MRQQSDRITKTEVMFNCLNILATLLLLNLSIASAPNEVLILINSQDTDYHRQLCEQLRKDILKQSQSIVGNHVINVKIIHEILNYPGDWTILTALPRLSTTLDLVNSKTKWIILCEDTTSIALHPLLDKLSMENHTEAFYLGHPLHDQEATIIHHFAFFENPRWFSYPLLRSGVIFTVPLLKRTAQQLASMQRPRTEFYIDASHELARFIMENVPVDSIESLDNSVDVEVVEGLATRDALYLKHADNNGLSGETHTLKRKYDYDMKEVHLKEASYICSRQPAPGLKEPCLMYPIQQNYSTCRPIRRDSIYFAIKTCQKFHEERIPAIENTWGRFAAHKYYFSDVEDKDIPTIATDVPNADTGHCAKTLSILKLALKDIENMNRYKRNQAVLWLFLSDDDTLLSVAGVSDILGCFNPLENIYLGERYGYRLHAKDGFNYITGGGGTALSLPVVRKILKHCTCPSITAPDDMVLGSCLHTLQIKAIHSSRFHQARPNDYNYKLLKIEKPISFHKFWQLDPEAVYEEWFANDDRKMIEQETLPLKQKQVLLKKPNRGRPRNSDYGMQLKDKNYKVMSRIATAQKLPLMDVALHSNNKHIDL